MIEEMTFGAALSMAWHCASKSGKTASPASGGTGGPQRFRNSRCCSSSLASRFAGGSGIQRLIWNSPWLSLRNSAAQCVISSGFMSKAPHAPSPPALATAMERDGGQAPAIGASKIGTRMPSCAAKSCARCDGRAVPGGLMSMGSNRNCVTTRLD